MTLYFSKDDILHIHSKLISDFGGSDGILRIDYVTDNYYNIVNQ